ncbi:hypothetical protein V8F33_010537 [Rhypophila sp. PSN 637]
MSSSENATPGNATPEKATPAPRVALLDGSICRPTYMAIMTSMVVASLLAGLDATAVSTAMPSIINDLGSSQGYTWIANSYLLTTTAFTPIFGQTANISGRRALTLGAIAIFAIGSAIAGPAPNLATLVAGRAIQGIGCAGISDVVIGVVDANRTGDEQDAKTVGYFLNMVPVRLRMGQGAEQFDRVAKKVRDSILGAFTHSHVPFDMMLHHLGLKGHDHPDNHPLFQVAINYRRAPLNNTQFGNDGKIKWDGPFVPGGHPYHLMLSIVSTPDWTLINFSTTKTLYRASDGELLLKWYTRALEALVRDPNVEVVRCPISNEAEIADAVRLGAGPAVELNARSVQIMRLLQSGVASESSPQRTAMLLDPVAEAVCCILAIWRAGHVWIPLDTRNHPNRIRAIVEESRPRILLCHDATEEMARQICQGMEYVSIVNIDRVQNSNLDPDEKLAQTPVTVPKDTAMIIYTSGSTGLPKGVLLTHGGLTNQIYGTCATLALGPGTRTLQQSPLGFDLMLDQIFLALCKGGTVVMAGKSHRGDPTRLAALMVRHGVTLTHFVPSEYLALLNYGGDILRTGGHSWRYAMSGGEKLTWEVLTWEVRMAFRKLESSTLELVNVYGPAEITLACARGIVPYRDPSTDGNDYLQICISGLGVGLGYLDRPEEKMRKFVQGKYRSGDKGRLLPDGTLEALGRMDVQDGQVKMHGFHIELDEIANATVHASNGAIVNAAVSLRRPPASASEDDAGSSSGILVAFVVFSVEFAAAAAGQTTSHFSEFLQKLRADLPLPHYMKPTLIIPTDRIPSNANGKTDRAALEKLANSITQDHDDNRKTTASAGDEKEEKKVVLSPMEESLKNTWEVKSLLGKQFGIPLSMPELFHNSTLSSMASLIERSVAALTATTHQQAGKDSATESNSFLRPRPAGEGEVKIDWHGEFARLADGLPEPLPKGHVTNGNNINQGSVTVPKKGLNVVLTGATGFIGRHMLSRLVQDDRVSSVHCLAIRLDPSTGQPRHVSIKSDKMVEYSGDLSQPKLGLSDEQFRNLTDHLADVIIHNGADVSLLKTYSSLRQPNVVSTRTLCEMAIPRRVPIHYISTASVAKVIQPEDSDDSSDEREFLSLLQVPANPREGSNLVTIDGYALSKWASEKLLEKVSSQTPGLRFGYIHRLAHVTGDDPSELDAVGMLLQYSLLLGALPIISAQSVHGQWDFIHVDEFVEDLVDMAISSCASTNHQDDKNGCEDQHSSERESGAQGAVFIHHCDEVKLPHGELRGHLEKVLLEGKAGGDGAHGGGGGAQEMMTRRIREIPMGEWLRLASERGLHPLVYEFYAAFNGEAAGEEEEAEEEGVEGAGTINGERTKEKGKGKTGSSKSKSSRLVLPLIVKY